MFGVVRLQKKDIEHAAVFDLGCGQGVQLATRNLLPDKPGRAHTVHLRHHDVQERHVGLEFPRDLHRFQAILRSSHFVPPQFQEYTKNIYNCRNIVGHEYAHHERFPGGCGR